MYPLIQTFINVHLAVYLIWRNDSTAKGAKKNTSPNVMRLQYIVIYSFTSVPIYTKLGAVLWLRPQKPRARVTEGMAR